MMKFSKKEDSNRRQLPPPPTFGEEELPLPIVEGGAKQSSPGGLSGKEEGAKKANPGGLSGKGPKLHGVIEVMPNSGHHFHFEEISEEMVAEWGESGKKLEALWKKRENEWQEVPHAKWIRYRPGVKEVFDPYQRLKGMWFAIESNLGPVTRGSVYVPYEEVEPRPFEKQTPSPYAYETIDQVPEENKKNKISFGFDSLYALKGSTPGVELEVTWISPLAQRPIEVDLIIDFGNTRTAALLLQKLPDSGAGNDDILIRMVKPLKFMPRGMGYSKSRELGSTIINSWFVTHETQFSEYEAPQLSEHEALKVLYSQEMKKKSSSKDLKNELIEAAKGLIGKGEVQNMVVGEVKLQPQMFVEMAPVVLDKDANITLAGASMRGGGRCFLSSPKRYAWDNICSSEESRLFWTMAKNFWSPKNIGGANPKMQAAVLRFLPVSGYDWSGNEPPWSWEPHRRPQARPLSPTFPNGDALTWMALAIIEQAQRQINAKEYWEDDFPYIPRVLKSVQVTYPSGWTYPELAAYQAKWRKALNIFAYSHLEDPSTGPKLEFPLDEAVASQLPVVYAEIEGMGKVGENWIRLIGRNREGKSVGRIMTIDIGGGTTDYAIIEYSDELKGHGVDLQASLILKDSSTIAGDSLVKELIESVLLPKLGEQHRNDEYSRSQFEDLFGAGIADQVRREEWRVITRLGLIPRVVSWLEDLSAGRDINIQISDSFSSDLEQQAAKLKTFAKEKEIIGIDILEPISVTTDEVIAAIQRTFEGLFTNLAKFVSAFEVDLLVVCGKPSEIPQVTDLLKAILPIPTQRVIIAKEFNIGKWYPFSRAGKIEDAKTMTSVGVALYKAIRDDRLPGWSITLQPSELSRYRNYWEIIQEENYTNILQPEQEENSVRVMNKTRIGRRLLNEARAEQVYILSWKGNNPDRRPPAQFEATFRRTEGFVGSVTEGIALVETEGVASDGSQISTYDFELKLCSLESGEYWIDEARFDVDWQDEEWD